MVLSIIKLLLSICDGLASYLREKQLIDLGTANAVKDNLYDTLEKIRKADAARRAVTLSGVSDDPDNRDND